MKPEIYVSVDVESDGPIPLHNSMLSLDMAAFLPNRTLLGTFEANPATLPGAVVDEETYEWWNQQPPEV
jgi:hypothetical protein